MELIGKIVQVLPLQSGTSKAGNPWQKQEYILETLGTQYPRKVCFNLFGDNVNKFPLQVGQEVTVSIDVESREFNGRWYTDVRAWNVVQGIQLPGVAAPAPAAYSAPQPAAPAAPVAPSAPAAPAGSVEAADDLPF
ncbi:DUF3127 domain-containing protein [Porphyromonas sp.]